MNALTEAELSELLMETTQRNCGGWPEPENQPPEKEGEADGQ